MAAAALDCERPLQSANCSLCAMPHGAIIIIIGIKLATIDIRRLTCVCARARATPATSRKQTRRKETIKSANRHSAQQSFQPPPSIEIKLNSSIRAAHQSRASCVLAGQMSGFSAWLSSCCCCCLHLHLLPLIPTPCTLQIPARPCHVSLDQWRY